MTDPEKKPEHEFLKKWGWIYDAVKDHKRELLSDYDICQLFISRFEAAIATTRKEADEEIKKLKAEVKYDEKVIEERGYAFQEAQNKSLLKIVELEKQLATVRKETIEECAKVAETCEMTLVTRGYDRIPREAIASALRKLGKE